MNVLRAEWTKLRTVPGPAIVLLAVLAVVIIGGEHGTGLIRATFTAMPHRVRVVAAKAGIVTGLVLAAGAIGVVGSLLVGRAVLIDNGRRQLSLADGAALRAAGGSVLYLTLVALLAFGLATALRDSAAAIGTTLALLYLAPIVGAALDAHARRHIDQIAPMSAGLDIQVAVGVRALALSPWQGLGVLALWSVGALALGAGCAVVRDA